MSRTWMKHTTLTLKRQDKGTHNKSIRGGSKTTTEQKRGTHQKVTMQK